jgi:hypothetical protein
MAVTYGLQCVRVTKTRSGSSWLLGMAQLLHRYLLLQVDMEEQAAETTRPVVEPSSEAYLLGQASRYHLATTMAALIQHILQTMN